MRPDEETHLPGSRLTAGVWILALPRFPSSAATTRVRFLQYLPALLAAGATVDVHPLLDQPYLDRLYSATSRRPSHVLRSYWGRLADVASARRYDVVWVAYEFLPMFPAIFERAGKRIGVPVVVDYDDATFHNYDLHPNRLVRKILGAKIDVVMRSARVVVAGNDYLAERARAAAAPCVEIVPTVVDAARYTPNAAARNRPFTIGWMGSPATARHLLPVWETLTSFSSQTKTRVLLIGIAQPPAAIPPSANIEIRPWSEEREIDDLHDFDVGIMPVPDRPFERGKCGYKLIQYLACGIPAVASPVGVNAQIIGGESAGLLAATPDEWSKSLHTLRSDPVLRERLGRAGRARVVAHYSLATYQPTMVSILARAAREPSPRHP